MKRGNTILILMAMVVLTVSMAFAQESGKDGKEQKAVKMKAGELVTQTVCPVMGEKIDKNIYVDYQGQRVYFCCQGCIDSFNKEPEKYFKKAAKENILFENVQTACPVSGDPVNKEFFSYHKGRGVYFCNQDCKAAFEKNPEKYMDKLKGQKKTGEKKVKEKKHEHKH